VIDELLQRGILLFNNREFFSCHEVLEEGWTVEAGPQRLFLQALIHLAVGFHHCERGNPAGASSQLQKGLHKLALYLPSCEGIDTARLHREGLAVLERIEEGVAVAEYPQIHDHTSSTAGS
jgi:predicted metal-dependent hydrolase